MPGLETWHIADRTGIEDEFDMCPVATDKPRIGGDAYRGDWADNINNFYLSGIQELYHIGKGNVRTAVFNKWGVVHVAKFGFTDPAGNESFITAADMASPARLADVKKFGHVMIERPIESHFNAPQAGKYRLTLYGFIPGNPHGALNVYVNGKLQQTVLDIHFPLRDHTDQPFALGDISLNAGDNIIAFDVGPIYMKWSDGTTALWTTPYLRKGFKVTNGDLTFADDYDRMWPDTWSGQKKHLLFQLGRNQPQLETASGLGFGQAGDSLSPHP